MFEPRIPLPLRIGIHTDLLARYPNADPVALSRWMGRWCNSAQYRRQIAAGGMRYDLDGFVAGEISADAVAVALSQLAAADPANHVVERRASA